MDHPQNFLKPLSRADIQKSYSFLRKRYEEFYHHTVPARYMHIIGDFLLVLLILFWGSYASISYIQQKFFASASARFIIITPGDIITAGQKATFLIRYENTTHVPLRDARITFQVHPLFESATSSQFSLNQETHTIEIGTIEAHQEKDFIFSGVPFGSLKDTQTLYGDLSFQNNKKEGREHIPAFVRYTIQKGALSHLSCAIPDYVTFYQIFNYTCTAKNSLHRPLEHISTEFSFPSSYTNRSQIHYTDYNLLSDEEKNISLLGFFQKQGIGAQNIIARTYITVRDKKYLQDETALSVRILAPALFLQVRHNPMTPFIHGKTYPFTLYWKNESNQKISDIHIRMFAHGDYLKDKEIAQKILSADPLQEGRVEFSLALDAPYELKKEATNHAFHITVEPSASYTDEKSHVIKVFSPPLQLDISSDISLQAFARYYMADGEQIGRGPLPPRAGKTTQYHVFLSPKNGIHDIKDFTITAQLGPHTAWTGIVPVGNDALRYYPDKKIITYAVPFLPSVFNASEGLFGAIFELALTPRAEDSGTQAVLLEAIRATGKDGITHTPLEFHANPITTDLLFDSKAKGMGTQVK
jgi:hypothetical protein